MSFSTWRVCLSVICRWRTGGDMPLGECLEVYYEPVTGAHVGPGTVALFFYGTEK